ncbi:MAG TPA: prephenate dehydratase domain-containing protein [Gemmatimonadaceae bacterium]|nr:prephenate dehydratase domain-containing protein [Gemmatimonadaceae bacterium]
MYRVAFQGAPGAYSEEAVLRACGDDAQPVPLRENRDVADAVADGAVDLGVLPVENTIAGSVPATYDAIIARPQLQAIGELVLPIHHCVLGPPGSSLETLRTVESHPIALAQCTAFFARHPAIHARAAYDTAGAASDVARAQDPARGALASRLAAHRYALTVLASDVEDRADNQTRFLVVSRTPRPQSAGVLARTILVLTVMNRPGALLALLTPLADHGLNMTKLESRPAGEPWAYRFVLEFEHLLGDPNVAEAMDAIRAAARSCHVVGTFAIDEAGAF